MAENSSDGVDLTKKVGPFPVWVWVVGLGLIIVVYLYYRNKNTASSTSSGTTSDAQIPQFVNQTYVQNAPPQASAPPPTSNTGGTTTSTGGGGSSTITGVGGNSAPPPPSPTVSPSTHYTTANETGSYYIATVKGTGKSYDVNPTKGTVHLLTPSELSKDIAAGAARATVSSKPIPSVHNPTIYNHPATNPTTTPVTGRLVTSTTTPPVEPPHSAPAPIQHSTPHYTTASQTTDYRIVHVGNKAYDVNPTKGTVHLLTPAQLSRDVAAGAKQVTSSHKPVAHPVIHRLSPHAR